MTWRSDLSTPFAYSTAQRTLGWLYPWLMEHHHPEYVRRLMEWLNAQDGLIGVGGGYRYVQPTGDTFAPSGKSFHQDQHYNDGFVGACAVDLVVRNPGHVHRAPRWDEVPKQGTAESFAWGVHCNVDQGAIPEPWHMQPIEIDGWGSWFDKGCPAPRRGYPLPTDAKSVDPVSPPLAPEPDDTLEMCKMLIIKYGGTPDANWAGLYSFDGGRTSAAVTSMAHAGRLVDLGARDAKSNARVTSRTWVGVTHVATYAEADRLVTPYA